MFTMLFTQNSHCDKDQDFVILQIYFAILYNLVFGEGQLYSLSNT